MQGVVGLDLKVVNRPYSNSNITPTPTLTLEQAHETTQMLPLTLAASPVLMHRPKPTHTH